MIVMYMLIPDTHTRTQHKKGKKRVRDVESEKMVEHQPRTMKDEKASNTIGFLISFIRKKEVEKSLKRRRKTKYNSVIFSFPFSSEVLGSWAQ